MQYAATPCLVFAGQAKPAIVYYENVFAMTRRRIIMDEAGDTVYHAHLSNGAFELMLWDESDAPNTSSSLHLLLTFTSLEELEQVYLRLTTDGQIVTPLAVADFGGWYAQVRDPFGILFALSFSEEGRESEALLERE
ncbi:VOC family protein [Exiguobacterium acetylicum]|uniref:VOC family protein n=1 Tax=Exiguobacterium acetylicum TaxID=41170 RepID=UPI001CA611A8|nr:VOC family protein [Exiguobacterium acetylicum]QZY87201.1 VOC family protein [Exiguobacterium acetylicum]